MLFFFIMFGKLFGVFKSKKTEQVIVEQEKEPETAEEVLSQIESEKDSNSIFVYKYITIPLKVIESYDEDFINGLELSFRDKIRAFK